MNYLFLKWYGNFSRQTLFYGLTMDQKQTHLGGIIQWYISPYLCFSLSAESMHCEGAFDQWTKVWPTSIWAGSVYMLSMMGSLEEEVYRLYMWHGSMPGHAFTLTLLIITFQGLYTLQSCCELEQYRTSK